MRKHELKVAIQRNIGEKNNYMTISFYLSFATVMNSGGLYILAQEYNRWYEIAKNHFLEHAFSEVQEPITRDMMKVAIYKMQDPDKLTVYSGKILNLIYDKMVLGTLATVAGTIAIGYCGVKSYQAWNKANEAREELAMLN